MAVLRRRSSLEPLEPSGAAPDHRPNHLAIGGEQLLRMPDFKLPAVCDVSVTNVCNAACDFCGFARDKTLSGWSQKLRRPASPARSLPMAGFCRAISNLW